MTGAAVQENVVEEKRENIEGEKEDGDVGAGGAVLGGTGIAEVEVRWWTQPNPTQPNLT